MALRNVFGALGLDATLQAIRDRLPAALVGGRLPVDGSGVTQPVSGPLTDAQLRASGVPVTGPLTNTQLRASPVPVSGTFWQTTQPVSATSLPLPTGASTEATLSALNAKIPASPATEGGNLATILGRLPAGLTVTATKLLVDVGTPTVTANAGTNLNTSALALEAGGNLAGIRADLGTDGTSPPTLPGGSTGVRGWLRYVGGLIPAFSFNVGTLDAGTLRVTLATDGQVATAIGSTAQGAAADDTSGSLLQRVSRSLQHLFSIRLSVGRISATGIIASNGDFVELVLNGQSSSQFQILGTWVGTLVFEQTPSDWSDGGTITVLNTVSPTQAPTLSVASSINVNQVRHASCAGAGRIRIRASAWTSGSASIQIFASPGVGYLAVALGAGAQCSGQQARGAAVIGNPFTIGLRGATAAPTNVTNGQSVDPLATVQGVAITRPFQIPELTWSYAAASGGIVNTTDNVLASAAGAGLRRYLTGLTLSNNSATATEVVVKDGASTVIRRFHVPANAPNFACPIPSPIFTSANAALNIACITTGAAVYANADGYTAP